MRRMTTLLALAMATVGVPVSAALAPGARAPMFTTQASLAGKPFRFALADALKKGPVVLYFYPKSFTSVCTLEAHAFADTEADLLESLPMPPGLRALTEAFVARHHVEEVFHKRRRDRADPEALGMRPGGRRRGPGEDEG